VRTEERGWAN